MLQPDQRVCRCAECAKYTIASGVGDIRGRIVPKRTYGLHQKLRVKQGETCNTQAVNTNANTTSEQHLRSLAEELENRSHQLILTGGLGFAIPPTVKASVPGLPTMDPNDLQLHMLSLRPDEPENIPVLEYERWLFVAKKEALPYTTGDDSLAENISVNLEKAFRNLQVHKVEEWERQWEVIHLREGLEILSDSLARREARTSFKTGIEPLVPTFYVLTAVPLLTCGPSLEDCTFPHPCVELIVRMSSGHASPVEQRPNGFPRDPRTVSNILELNPDTNAFVCCPKCFALYPSNEEVPKFCTFGKTSTRKLCNEPLTQSKKVGGTTRRVFLREYLDRILKAASVTAIHIVLLNMPPPARYKVESMHLTGVVPRPREPSIIRINHLLQPLVNDLLEFWDPNAWYTRTPNCFSGKLVKVALVPLTCDLRAARQEMGHGSYSAKKFCSICSLPWEWRNGRRAGVS